MLGFRGELDGDFGNQAEQAFRAIDECQQIVTRRVQCPGTKLKYFAVQCDHSHLHHIMYREAIFQAVNATCILRDISANGAHDLARWIGRIEQSVRSRGSRHRRICHARLHPRCARRRIDVQYFIHARQHRENAVFKRDRAARYTGTGTARHQWHAARVTYLDDRGDLRL